MERRYGRGLVFARPPAKGRERYGKDPNFGLSAFSDHEKGNMADEELRATMPPNTAGPPICDDPVYQALKWWICTARKRQTVGGRFHRARLFLGILRFVLSENPPHS